jgi:tetratricopeptide (TPR) repeat protein
MRHFLGFHPASRRLAAASSLALLLLGLWPAGVSAESSAAAFESANKLYEEGKFSDAASAYEKLALSGQASEAVYFNLGNALFKSGQIGRAIAAYRRAEQIAPRDPDVRANLQFARKQTAGPSLSPSRWQRWLGRLNLNEWTLLTVGAGWLWLLMLAARQCWPALRPSLRGYVLFLAAATVFLGACLGAALYENRVARTAIVVVPDAVVRLGPVAESQDSFTAHDGAELRVLDQKDEWLEVTAGPGRFGWLRRDQVLLSASG